MSILDTVEASLKDFRPKTHRQFVVFNIASRFDDLTRLARYINVCELHPKRVLLDAAKQAAHQARQNDQSAADVFFELLDVRSQEAPQ